MSDQVTRHFVADVIIDSLPKCKYSDEREQQMRQLLLDLPENHEVFQDDKDQSIDQVLAEFSEVMTIIDEGGKYRFQLFDGMDYFVISKVSDSNCSDCFHDAFDVDSIRAVVLGWAREDFHEIRPNYM